MRAFSSRTVESLVGLEYPKKTPRWDVVTTNGIIVSSISSFLLRLAGRGVVWFKHQVKPEIHGLGYDAALGAFGDVEQMAKFPPNWIWKLGRNAGIF
jgi:hypothetical protein